MGTIYHVKAWAYMPIMDLIDTGKLKDMPMLIVFGDGKEDWMWPNIEKCHDTINMSEPLEQNYLQTIFKQGNSKLSQ